MPDRQTDRGLDHSPEAPEADVADEYAREDEPLTVPDEANDADAAEQHHRARETGERWPDSVPVEANEADAADQHWSVRDEDDDYR